MADRIQRSRPLLTNFESSTNQSLGYNHVKGISITTYMCRVVLQGHKTDRTHIFELLIVATVSWKTMKVCMRAKQI